MDGRLCSQFSHKKPQIFQNEHTPKSNWNIVAQAFRSTKKEKKTSHYCRTAIWSPTWPNKHQPPEIPSIDSPIQLPSFYINHPNEAVRNSLTHSERGGKKKPKLRYMHKNSNLTAQVNDEFCLSVLKFNAVKERPSQKMRFEHHQKREVEKDHSNPQDGTCH